jgi:hypothetical protein
MATEPDYFGSFTTLLALADTYDAVTDNLWPDETTRVARKEALVADMAGIIEKHVPLGFAAHARTLGLRAGFARAIGEHGKAIPIMFACIHKIATWTQPTDDNLNLKNQIIRAYGTLLTRFPDAKAQIAAAFQADLPHLSDHADNPLTANITKLETALGITA